MNVRLGNGLPSLIASLLFFAVVGKPLSSNAAPSSRPGYGSIPYSGGVTFRVWAPHATTVTVEGQFNGFSTTANPLYHDPTYSQGTDWVWSVDVPAAVAGQQYKYYLNGNTAKQDPRCRQQISSVGYSIIYTTTNFNWAGDNFTAPALSDAVVYELNIGSFYNPNSPGNAGTFYNATNRLAYLKQLGISAIEVMPIQEFPGNLSWGYNPSDIFGVESSYGGPDAFKTFVKTAHQFGLAVILDVVHNHYGTGDLDLWRYDGWNAGNGDGGIYFEPTAVLYTTPYGDTRPNFTTQQVRNFIQDNFTMWLSECHVDGFRWDSPGYMIHDNNGNLINDAVTLLQLCSSMIHTGYTGKINIGEDQSQYIGANGFDATWANGPFQGNVVPQLTTSSDTSRNMNSINTAVNLNHNGAGSSGWGNVVYLESHDSAGDLNGGQRLPVQIDTGNPVSLFARKRSTLGSAITLTTAGIPMILQGEEMLTTNQFTSQTGLNWSLTNTYSGIVQLYTDLIHLRRNTAGLTSGLKGWSSSTLTSDNNAKLYAYRRWDTGSAGDDVVVIANFANAPRTNFSVTFPKTGTWYTQFNSDWSKYSFDYGDFGSASVVASGGSITGLVSIAPYSVLILSQNVPGAPPTPQNLSATSAGATQINLAWNIASAATGYIVKRGGSQIATTTATNYTDTGLTTGTMYCYTVVATNIGGVSADSAQACATPGAPPTPQNLNATTISTNRINLVWNSSTAATGYIVKRGGSQIAATAVTNYSDIGLLAGTTYCYTVAATNAGGVSADSSTACTMTTVPSTSATNLLAYWTFDEGSGTIAYDSSGYANTGTVVNATWTSGMINGALAFDGETADVTVPYSASLNPVSTITIAAWINAASWANTPRILEKGNDDQYALFLNGSGQLEFFLAGVTNGAVVATPPSAGVWHHVAATYDGLWMNLYIDGQLAAQQSAGGPLAITPEMLVIGGSPSGSPLNLFDGVIDDVQIYGSSLPAAQINQFYSTDTVGDGIPNWWRQQYFGISSSTNAASCITCDFDGTGQNNQFKFFAGLDPTNPASAFRIISLAPQGNNLLATWTTVGGHSNVLQSTLGRNVGSYSNQFIDFSPVIVVPGTGPTTTNFLIVGALTPPAASPASQEGPTNLANSGTSTVELMALDTRGLGDDGGGVPVGGLLMMGTFGMDHSTIQSNFNAGNINAIMAAFTAYGGPFAVGQGLGCPGGWDVQAGEVGFGGLQLYVVAFDQPTIAASTQMGIFTSPSWVFPIDADASLDIETATDFVIGSNGGSVTINCSGTYTFNDSAQLAIIPSTTRFFRVRLAP